MRPVAVFALMPFVAFARTITVSPLPPSEYADTEVSTNIAFVVGMETMSRIEFTVALDATPTNNVEVTIGTDANGDGNLSVEEAVYVFGYDCGSWFERSQSKSEIEVEQWNFPSDSAGQPEQEGNILCSTSTSNFDLSSHTFVLKMRNLDTAWNLVKVTRRGCGAACELVKAEGHKPGFMLEVR